MTSQLFQTDLRRYKQAIRTFIRAHWSDQKVAEVYAFNADDKMIYDNSCACIRGVTLSDTLHTEHCGQTRMRVVSEGFIFEHAPHYMQTATMPGAMEAEQAFLYIGITRHGFDPIRKRRMSAILRAELRRRDRIRAAQRVFVEAVASYA